MAWSLFSSGISPLSWATALLRSLGAPTTSANEQSIIAWALNEGGGGNFNPLNTTLPAAGASCFNSVCVRNYTSWQQGIQATVGTLQSNFYNDIRAALQSGQGLGSGNFGGLSKWSGGGYSNVAGNWSKAAQFMSGKAVPLPGGGSNITAQTMGFNPFGGLGSSLFSGLLSMLGLGSLKDLFIRLGLILLGGLLVLLGIFILVGRGGMQTAVTTAAPEARIIK